MEVVGLIAAAIAIGQFLYLIYLKTKKRRDIRIYENSSSSDTDMLNDLLNAKTVSFFGSAMTDLSNFLRRSTDQQGGAKFETFYVYFSNLDDGKIWQGNKFRPNVLESLKNLSHFISEAETLSVRNNFVIKSYIQSHHSTYAGCCINNGIVYVVNYVAGKDINRKDGITFRLHHNNSGEIERKLYKEYSDSHKQIREKAIPFARLSGSVWDNSVIQWNNFISQSEAYRKNMRNVILSLNLVNGLNVLEIACGNGVFGKLIQKEGHDLNLFLTDNSGKMLKACEHNLNHNKTKILYFDPVENAYNWNMFFPENIKFDRIVSHLSFPFPEMDDDDFERLIDFLYSSLNDNGLVVISVHNTTVSIDNDTYSKESDDFRLTLISKFKSQFGRKAIRKIESKKIMEKEFSAFFAKKGFNVVGRKSYEYNFTMHDRVRMWSTPSILNSMFDLTRCNLSKVRKIMNEMSGIYGDRTTLPLSSVIYTISKGKKVFHSERNPNGSKNIGEEILSDCQFHKDT